MPFYGCVCIALRNDSPADEHHGLSRRQHKRNVRLVGEEVIDRATSAGAGGEAVVVEDHDASDLRQPEPQDGVLEDVARGV